MRRAELAFNVGDYELVVAIVERLDLGAAAMRFTTSGASQLARFQGQALMELGRFKEARAAFDNAYALISHDQAHFQRWELFAAMAELDDLEGDTAASLKHRAQARAEIEYLAARISDPELEASFRARPDVAVLLASG